MSEKEIFLGENNNNNVNSGLRYFIWILLAVFTLRGITLGVLDLIDPSESRYAFVAQEMLLSNDWVVPKLQMSDGLADYMSKPPLHFWATALCYKLFGVSEWSSRLPSFLSAVLIAICLIGFAQRYINAGVGVTAAIITLSSGLFFFFSGASILDLTFTAGVVVSTVSLLFHLDKNSSDRFFCSISAIFAAAAFLIKGPVALIYIIGTPLIFAFLKKEFFIIKRFNWVLFSIVFTLVIFPWLYLAELRSPGFLKYFIWNENIGRYLFKDYGDKYGYGHVHPRGFSWLMLLVSFLPWTPFVVYQIWQKGKDIFNDRISLIIIIWGLLPVAFLTFIRQLHAGYILPCIPPFALFLANSLTGEKKQRTYTNAALCVVVAYVITLLSLSNHINTNRSAEPILREVAFNVKEPNPEVGVFMRNTYSHYWASKSWELHLAKPVKIISINLNSPVYPRNIILKAREIEKLPKALMEKYRERTKIGAWIWLEMI